MYQQVVVGIELNKTTDRVLIKKCQTLFNGKEVCVTLVHAIEQLGSYGAAYGVAAGISVDDVLHEEATKELSRFAKTLGVDLSRQIIKAGPAKQVVVEAAKELHADLIIVGSHGRHGMQLLLGSTANGVLHQATCDVLSIRVR